MENRFGFKDLLIIVLLLVTLISIWFWMTLQDRQHELLLDINDAQKTQADLLRSIDQQLRSGVAVSTGSNATDSSGNVPPDSEYFPRLMAPREDADFAFGDWFIDSFAQTVGKLTPIVQADAYQAEIERYVLESLIIRDPDTLEWRPWIAHKWTVAEDGLSIAYDLREDVVFSDGEPLTSEDVVFTYDLIMNPDIDAAALRTYYENISRVEAEGPHRVVFYLDEPYFRSLDFTGGMSILPKHFYEQFTPDQFNSEPGLLLGSGPYRLSVDPLDWEPGSGEIALVRNDNYWGPRPTFDRLVFREIPDESAELVAFRNRQIDRYGLTPERYERLKDDPNLLAQADLYEYATPTGGYRYIGWNQRRDGEPTFFADRDVRLAMTLLTNRQEMSQQLMAGLATVATGPFNPLGKQADPGIEPWPYEPDEAIALLKKAGFADRDDNGVLENEAGEEFRFKLIYPAGSVNYKQMAFYLKDAYARAKIALEPEPLEWNTMLQRINERNFDAITLGWTGSIEGDPKQIFHSSSMAAGGSNYISYSNEKLDQLIDDARTTLDEQERLEMWREAHQILHHGQPYTFLFFSKAVIFIDKRMKNVDIIRTGMNDRREMYVPTDLQRWSE